ncbi:MAG: beta-lactamase family protein, partial [Planctomycetes bacterium]|nr:beta-lactamase family protein [Planctomycetota bacterium]
QSLGCHDLQALPPISQQLLATAPNSARHAVRLDLPSGLLYEQSFGTFTPTTVVAIASATKTLSAAVLMSLVDSNVLTLDDRVGQYLPEWNSGARASITLRMCFTHTAGMPGNNGAISDEAITLRQAAQQLATAPLLATPGSEFRYGNVSMHVAGAVCEVASGQSWATLFAQRIAGPLQLTATDFEAFGPTQNPRIAGGARSTLRDFARFMAMLRDGGVANGVTVLSAASAQTLLTAQTVGVPIASSPHPYLAPYGIGIWIDRRDSQGRTLLASGVGAFGFHGWVDRAHGLSGTLAVQFLNQSVYPFVERIQAEADAAVLPAGTACVGAACAPAVWLNTTLPARTGAADFALRCDRAPAGLPGVFMVGAPDPVGVPLGDLASHLGLDFAVVAPATADALGRAALPAPLVGAPAGSSFGLQTVWPSGAPCLALLLQASHAVRIDVLP